MAFQTKFLAQIDNATAVLNWNDVTNTATGFTVNNTLGTVPVTAYYVLTGHAQASITVAAGASQQMILPSATAITIAIGSKGINGFNLTGLSKFGMGTGSGIGT